MSDIEFEKLIRNLKDLKKELELKIRYKDETTQLLTFFVGNCMTKVISEKPVVSFKHVCTKCGYELEYNEIDLVCNIMDYEGDSIEKPGMYLVCPRTECNRRTSNSK